MLEKKIEQVKELVKDTFFKAKVPFVEFTGGKDSLVTLHLVREVCVGPVSVLFIDTSAYFNEIYHFIEKIKKLWRFNLIIEKNKEALGSIKIAEDKAECCLQLKTKVRRDSIKKYGIDYLFTGLRMDEKEATKNLDYVFPEAECVRVNPILYFSEKDIWEYIRENNLLYCSLYNKGYTNIDCIPCSQLPKGPPEDPVAEHHSDMVMKKLKDLGYM
jgi:phosphoadenosine phosphosulfate reductase